MDVLILARQADTTFQITVVTTYPKYLAYMYLLTYLTYQAARWNTYGVKKRVSPLPTYVVG